MIRDPLPGLVAIREMLVATHRNDALVLAALNEAERCIVAGDIWHARIGLSSSRASLRLLDMSPDARAALDLAVQETL